MIFDIGRHEAVHTGRLGDDPVRMLRPYDPLVRKNSFTIAGMVMNIEVDRVTRADLVSELLPKLELEAPLHEVVLAGFHGQRHGPRVRVRSERSHCDDKADQEAVTCDSVHEVD